MVQEALLEQHQLQQPLVDQAVQVVFNIQVVVHSPQGLLAVIMVVVVAELTLYKVAVVDWAGGM
jgi:hypothetical protein